ncbi:serine/threonine-protein phosphatase 7 long form homolog isoform X2 [Apium graveolens]
MDPHEELGMHPRPRNGSMLHLQADHRSSVVWDAGGGDNLRSRRRNPNSVRFPQLHPRMVPLLTDLRFDGVSRLTGIQIDWSLITALIERWRPETHTFHLPIGECTITLQDVSVLLGLRIDGDAVIGVTAVDDGWANVIQHIFGANPVSPIPVASGLVGGRLKFSWLNSVFHSLPDDASDGQLRQYTQSYLLQLIGGILFTDHSGGQVHCMYIHLIEDLERCGTLSWGSAVLAYLYRELCKSCKKDREETAGCILLLQLWAWSRLHTLAPVPRGPSLNNLNIWGNQPGPHGLRWCAHLSFTDSGSHSVATYRLQLDLLTDSHFKWQPYTEEILAALPQHCREGSGIWRYKGPLICFCFVEPHHPDRCLRQFGMIQDIPSPAAYSHDLHKIDLKGKTDSNWLSIHRDHLALWIRREQLVSAGQVGDGVSDGYHTWYSSITLRYLTRIGGGHSYMLDLLDHIDSVQKGEREGDILAITAHARRVLQDNFSAGYYQDFPIEDRRAKEAVFKVKKKRVGHGGGRGGVNAPRRRGGQPNGQGSVHGKDEGDDHVHDEGIVLFDDDGGDFMRISEAVADIQEDEAERNGVDARAGDPTQQLCHPNWESVPPSNHLPIYGDSHDAVLYHSSHISPPHEQEDIDPIPPLSHPTLTQSPPHPSKKLLQQPLDESVRQQQTVQQPTQKEPVHMKLRARKHEASTHGTHELRQKK